MRKLVSLTILVVIMLASSVWSAGDVKTGYLMKVGDYFDVSYDDVDMIASGNIELEDVPAIFYMARLSEKSPKSVLAMIERGARWSTFMKQNEIDPAQLLIPIYDFDTPECKAIGDKIRNRPLSKVVFDHQDIRILVNYKMISETNNIKYADLVNNRNQSNGSVKTFAELSNTSIDQTELVQSDSK